MATVFGATIDPNCPARHPCLCTIGILNCEAKNLTVIPSLSGSTTFMYPIVKLGNNGISTIGAAAFVGLASVNVSTLLLDHNSINRIEVGAFAGIENSIRVLNLAHNRLLNLPIPVGKLSILTSLDVSSNPIPGYSRHGRYGSDGLTDSVMTQIGDKLKKFSFGSKDALKTWPRSLNHLIRLQELKVSGSSVMFFPANAFYGFTITLKKLTIENAALAAVPIGINSLVNLEELHLDNLGYPFGDDSMISAPFSNLAGTLKVLSLKNDSLTVFPEVIQQLSALENLTLDGNNLQFVSDDAIKLLITANVSTLSLRNCNLKRVPGAISDLTYLLNLDLDGNQIRSLESTDLQNLNHLKTLSVSSNPLRYISDNALCGLNELVDFYLINTSLTEVSRSFQILQKLKHLDLTDSRIDCTCDITWMKKWKENCQLSETKVEIDGNCETINQGIEYYINNRLRECPDYTEEVFHCGGLCSSK